MAVITQRAADPMHQQHEPEKKGMDPKTQQAIAVVALIFALLVGGGIVYWFLFGSKPTARTVTVDPKQQTVANAGMRMARPPRPANGVEVTGENAWQARSPNATVNINKGPDGIYQFNYSFAIKPSPDQLQIALARWRTEPRGTPSLTIRSARMCRLMRPPASAISILMASAFLVPW